MGLERTLAVLNDKELVFDTELFQPIFLRLEKISGNNYEESEETKKSFRIISDHIKTGVFMIADGVIPSNVDRGYVLRRLIRRAIRHGKLLGMEKNFTKDVAEVIVEMYKDFYPELGINKVKIFGELEKEENKFRKTLADGLAKIEKYLKNPEGNLIFRKIENEMQQAPVYFHSDAVDLIFDLYQTDGFPLEMALEELKKKAISLGVSFDEDKLKERFNEKFKQHQELSRTASAGMFKGGLQSQDEQTTRLHTATHLLQAALRQVLGTHVYQKGSNITPERLRFDFSHPEKMTPEQIKRVEDLVNVKIKENLGIKREEMTPEEAKTVGALGVFEAKYGDRVSVYSAGSFSKEICGGPHVKSTGELGHFKIKKEEASSAGVRRIKAVLE
jgi:alanyl-tRNA synthetase